jgi:hypothetical protein
MLEHSLRDSCCAILIASASPVSTRSTFQEPPSLGRPRNARLRPASPIDREMKIGWLACDLLPVISTALNWSLPNGRQA